jgi:HAD superfamily hydrolase (TIGR01509 family)
MASQTRALLFDLDGTLVDTDPLHLVAWQDVLRPHGFEIDAEAYRQRISGRLNPAIVRDYLPDLDEAQARAFAARKEAMFRDAATDLRALPGLQRLLERARAAEMKLALVTNAPLENMQHLLAVLQLHDAFDVEVLADEIGVGKPDPAPYLHALQRLAIAPEAGLAFEDSVSGVRSARRAGLRVVGLTTTQAAATLAHAGADPIVADFEDAELSRLLGW